MTDRLWRVLMASALLAASGCGRSDQGIRMEGSDTMVNVAQAWAEDYGGKHPEVNVQVLGGGSGVGIASLIDGNCDMANASRKMEDKEIQRVRAKRGVDPKEYIVGYDALAIYVNKNNPLESISLEELAEIYGDGGKITKWSQLGVESKVLGSDAITRVSRQNSSGTYAYFREAVLGKGRDYKLGTIDQSGSKDVVALIANTPSAIGYSGMGYDAPGVKMLPVSKRKGEPGVSPTVEHAKQGTYPITRPLMIYTAGEPEGRVKAFLDWILSREGQKVVLQLGYVPVGEHE
jgi:phosphate transport system substrate-binding protein